MRLLKETKTPYDEQLQRIKEKVIIAKNADPEFDVFAADEHEYQLNVPATEEEVLAFEHKYSIRLPECYRSFLLVVGHGGINTDRKTGAGPGYGLYPLYYAIDNVMRLTEKCELDPEKDQQSTSYKGVLMLGTHGCTYEYGIVLNGPHTGRMVNLDRNHIVPPIFTPDTKNFLDYYEGWLDRVIDGTLQKPGAPEYGY